MYQDHQLSLGLEFKPHPSQFKIWLSIPIYLAFPIKSFMLETFPCVAQRPMLGWGLISLDIYFFTSPSHQLKLSSEMVFSSA